MCGGIKSPQTRRPGYRLTRSVAIVFGLNRTLLFRLVRIAVTRILPLIARQRCGSWSRAPVPLVPSASTRFPVAAPVLTPMWWRVVRPAAKVHWRLAVVANRNAQHERWHHLKLHQLPG
jgi:hypothetical protein